jgi:hypothetical protein
MPCRLPQYVLAPIPDHLPEAAVIVGELKIGDMI